MTSKYIGTRRGPLNKYQQFDTQGAHVDSSTHGTGMGTVPGQVVSLNRPQIPGFSPALDATMLGCCWFDMYLRYVHF